MKTKIIIISLIIFLLSLSVASAADNTTLVKDQTPIKAIEKSDCTYKTYENLKQAIETSKNGDTIKLTHDLIHYDDYNGFEKTPKITINQDNLVIDGQCHTIDGNHHGIFEINGKNITLKNLILINGKYGEGGALHINSKSKCNLINVKISGNEGSKGGGVYTQGELFCKDCVFGHNEAKNYGGAIYIAGKGSCEITNTKFIQNEAREDSGGAIYTEGNLNIKNSLFTHHYAKEDGGAVCAKGHVDVDNSTFTLNKATGARVFLSEGGAIYCAGINCKNSTFKENYASQRGGAIHINNKGLSVIENSKFIENEAYKKGGAINIDDTSAHVVIKNNSFKGNTVEDGEGSIVYNYGHFDKISNNYYGTNNPDWKNALYEHKYFGFDVEHKDSNPVML